MGRYVCAHEVKVDTRLRLSPEGFCNWCGKALTGRSKYFCPPYEKVIYSDYKRKDYWCTNGFMMWWCSIPRFKRAVYLRDKFTCQNCQLKPMTKNKHGLEIPDLTLLAIDHIFPYAKGGGNKDTNLQVLCRKCNSRKSDKVPTVFQEEMGQRIMPLEVK